MTSTGTNLGGAWRDRTNLYISYRQSYSHNTSRLNGPNASSRRFRDHGGDSEREGLMSSLDNDGDVTIEMDILPPRWLDIEDEISSSLVDIASQMKKLDQLHAKHILPGFDDESVKAKEERDIEHLTQEITRGFTMCGNRIRRIDAMLRNQQNQPGGQVSDAEEQMARNLKISLATRVGEFSAQFRKKQSAYLKKMRSLGGMPAPNDRAAASMTQNPYTDPAMMESETDRSSAQSTLLQTAQARKRSGAFDSTIEQREREIEKIAQGVIDLSNIFQELNSMVIDQGSLLDRIDYNVERTAEHVKEADKELKVATGYQKKSVKRKIILLLILLVAGLFILLLIKPKRHAAEPLPPAPPAEVQPPDAGFPPRYTSAQAFDHVDSAQRVARRRWEYVRPRRRAADIHRLMM